MRVFEALQPFTLGRRHTHALAEPTSSCGDRNRHKGGKKNSGTVGPLSARAPPPPGFKKHAHIRSAEGFFTWNQIPLCARHSSFISRMCFWSSTNIETQRGHWLQRPSPAPITCLRDSFAFSLRPKKFVLLEGPSLIFCVCSWPRVQKALPGKTGGHCACVCVCAPDRAPARREPTSRRLKLTDAR